MVKQLSMQGLILDHLNSQRPCAASARTQPVCPFSRTFSCISEAGGSHTAMLFAAFPQNTYTMSGENQISLAKGLEASSQICIALMTGSMR